MPLFLRLVREQARAAAARHPRGAPASSKQATAQATSKKKNVNSQAACAPTRLRTHALLLCTTP